MTDEHLLSGITATVQYNYLHKIFILNNIAKLSLTRKDFIYKLNLKNIEATFNLNNMKKIY